MNLLNKYSKNFLLFTSTIFLTECSQINKKDMDFLSQGTTFGNTINIIESSSERMKRIYQNLDQLDEDFTEFINTHKHHPYNFDNINNTIAIPFDNSNQISEDEKEKTLSTIPKEDNCSKNDYFITNIDTEAVLPKFANHNLKIKSTLCINKFIKKHIKNKTPKYFYFFTKSSEYLNFEFLQKIMQTLKKITEVQQDTIIIDSLLNLSKNGTFKNTTNNILNKLYLLQKLENFPKEYLNKIYTSILKYIKNKIILNNNNTKIHIFYDLSLNKEIIISKYDSVCNEIIINILKNNKLFPNIKDINLRQHILEYALHQLKNQINNPLVPEKNNLFMICNTDDFSLNYILDILSFYCLHPGPTIDQIELFIKNKNLIYDILSLCKLEGNITLSKDKNYLPIMSEVKMYKKFKIMNNLYKIIRFEYDSFDQMEILSKEYRVFTKYPYLRDYLLYYKKIIYHYKYVYSENNFSDKITNFTKYYSNIEDLLRYLKNKKINLKNSNFSIGSIFDFILTYKNNKLSIYDFKNIVTELQQVFSIYGIRCRIKFEECLYHAIQVLVNPNSNYSVIVKRYYDGLNDRSSKVYIQNFKTYICPILIERYERLSEFFKTRYGTVNKNIKITNRNLVIPNYLFYTTDNLYLVFLHPRFDKKINLLEGDLYLIDQFIDEARKIKHISRFFLFDQWFKKTLDKIFKFNNYQKSTSALLLNSKILPINKSLWSINKFENNSFSKTFNSFILCKSLDKKNYNNILEYYTRIKCKKYLFPKILIQLIQDYYFLKD